AVVVVVVVVDPEVVERDRRDGVGGNRAGLGELRTARRIRGGGAGRRHRDVLVQTRALGPSAGRGPGVAIAADAALAGRAALGPAGRRGAVRAGHVAGGNEVGDRVGR